MAGPKVLIDFSTAFAALGIDARGPVEFRPELGELLGLQIKLLDLTRVRRPVLQPRGILSTGPLVAPGAGLAWALTYTAPRGCYVIGASAINEAILGEAETAPTLAGAVDAIKTEGELGLFGTPRRGTVAAGSLSGFQLRGVQDVDGVTVYPGEASPILWVGPGRTVYLVDSVGNAGCRHSLAIIEPYAT